MTCGLYRFIYHHFTTSYPINQNPYGENEWGFYLRDHTVELYYQSKWRPILSTTVTTNNAINVHSSINFIRVRRGS